MQFRPCIDIHHGKVKQIVGGTLRDGAGAEENFVSKRDAAWYAGLYRGHGLTGGHIIMLDPAGSAEYAATKAQALAALRAWPGGLQIGGGITAANAPEFLEAGASHVIVTSYVFRDGRIDEERLRGLVSAVGRERLVLDLSCRKKDGRYFIVTDRWQKFTDTEVDRDTLHLLSDQCAEFLVHAADVEGRVSGIEKDLLRILAADAEIPVTYAGGIRGMEDIRWIRECGAGRIHFTVGSALDLFGGNLPFADVLAAAD